jgi:hypothetical protein
MTSESEEEETVELPKGPTTEELEAMRLPDVSLLGVSNLDHRIKLKLNEYLDEYKVSCDERRNVEEPAMDFVYNFADEKCTFRVDSLVLHKAMLNHHLKLLFRFFAFSLFFFADFARDLDTTGSSKHSTTQSNQNFI